MPPFFLKEEARTKKREKEGTLMYKGDTLYRCSEERIKERLSAFTDSTEAVTDTFIGQMRRLGADIISDDLGNI